MGLWVQAWVEVRFCLNLNSASLHRTFHDCPSVILMTEMLLKTELQTGGSIQDNSKIIFPNFLTETYVVTRHRDGSNDGSQSTFFG